MRIKKYIQFIKESSGYEYGCVMIEVPVKNWKEITSYIDPEDVYTGGDDTHNIQENPHVTILYGLHKEVTPEMIKSVFDNFTDNINIVVDGIDIFENEDYDVVKFNVKADGALQYLHDELSKFPNSNSFSDYKPHITIAYVKKGSGKKYIKPEYKYEVKNVDKITYSMPSGEKVKFDYKINESVWNIEYDSEWKSPTNPIRKELESYLRNILLELIDLGYRTQIGGFVKGVPHRDPYVWICNHRRLSHDDFWNEIGVVVETIKGYLESEGFSTKIRILNEGTDSEQIYIHFYKVEEGLNEKEKFKMKKLETYKSFLESQKEYSIFDFYDYLRNNHWSNTDISTLERWTDHFVGEGWWNKIKSHVDRIFQILSEVDLNHIKDAMLEIYDNLPDEKEKNIYCSVLYGDYEKINDSNDLKYNGTMPIFESYDMKRKSYILHNIIFEIVRPTVSYSKITSNDIEFRLTPEAEFVTDKKWQCQNFDFSQFTDIRDYEGNSLKLYSPENVLSMYQPGVVIDIGGWSSVGTGQMSLLDLEKELDDRIDLITAELDYEEVLWPFSRKERYFDTSRPIYDYTLKILLKM